MSKKKKTEFKEKIESVMIEEVLQVKEIKLPKVIKKHNFYLVVNTNFRNYKRGHMISDYEEINRIVNCHEISMVNKVLT